MADFKSCPECDQGTMVSEVIPNYEICLGGIAVVVEAAMKSRYLEKK